MAPQFVVPQKIDHLLCRFADDRRTRQQRQEFWAADDACQHVSERRGVRMIRIAITAAAYDAISARAKDGPPVKDGMPRSAPNGWRACL
jgi:hypothetical protein